MSEIRDSTIKKLNEQGYKVTIEHAPGKRPTCSILRMAGPRVEDMYMAEGTTDEEAVLLAAQRLARSQEL